MPVIFFKWTEKHQQKAHTVLDQDTDTLNEEQYEKFENTAHRQWDKFYKNHKLGFFHHRYKLQHFKYNFIQFLLLSKNTLFFFQILLKKRVS